MKIRIKRLHPDAVMPTKATEMAVGYDLYVRHDICIEHPRQVVPLGFALEMPKNLEAKIEPRSGFSAKGIEGFALMNGREEEELWQRIDKTERFNADVLVGKIDPDYRGEVGVIIRNNDCIPFLIAKGTRIAQMTFYPVLDADFEESDELSDTDRGDGGYGSTGR